MVIIKHNKRDSHFVYHTVEKWVILTHFFFLLEQKTSFEQTMLRGMVNIKWTWWKQIVDMLFNFAATGWVTRGICLWVSWLPKPNNFFFTSVNTKWFWTNLPYSRRVDKAHVEPALSRDRGAWDTKTYRLLNCVVGYFTLHSFLQTEGSVLDPCSGT